MERAISRKASMLAILVTLVVSILAVSLCGCFFNPKFTDEKAMKVFENDGYLLADFNDSLAKIGLKKDEIKDFRRYSQGMYQNNGYEFWYHGQRLEMYSSPFSTVDRITASGVSVYRRGYESLSISDFVIVESDRRLVIDTICNIIKENTDVTISSSGKKELDDDLMKWNDCYGARTTIDNTDFEIIVKANAEGKLEPYYVYIEGRNILDGEYNVERMQYKYTYSREHEEPARPDKARDDLKPRDPEYSQY